MRKQTFHLTVEGRVTLTAYLIEDSQEMTNWEKRPAVLVLPGGGYSSTSAREADPIAFHFLAQGFHTFVLHYSVAEHGAFPAPFIDASRAMQIIREHAEEWRLDADRLALCGFSAGGHLAASLGTMWNDPQLIEAAGIQEGDNKPNALILGYPVITCKDDTTGALQGMWNIARGEHSLERMRDRLCCELHVGIHTPPAFIFHTFMDHIVPVEHSLIFAQALAKHDVPFAMHIFPNGVHGMALGNEITAAGRQNLIDSDAGGWMSLSTAWLWRLFEMGEALALHERANIAIPRAKLK